MEIHSTQIKLFWGNKGPPLAGGLSAFILYLAYQLLLLWS